MTGNQFCLKILKIGNKEYQYFPIEEIASGFGVDASKLPYSLRILLEASIRKCDGVSITKEDISQLANWLPKNDKRQPLAFFPARVVLQDFTGVPVLVDLAAMRTELERRGGIAHHAAARRDQPYFPDVGRPRAF